MINATRYLWLTALLAVFGIGTPPQALGQACIGFPNSLGQLSVAATAAFPTGGELVGAEAAYNVSNPLSVYGGVHVESREVGNDILHAGGGLAVDVPLLADPLPAGMSVCPTAAVSVASAEGIDDIVSVPVGIGFGTHLTLGETMTVSPWVMPQIRWKTSGDNTSTDWLVSGGVLLSDFLGPVYVGATVNRIFIDNTESVIGMKLGVTL